VEQLSRRTWSLCGVSDECNSGAKENLSVARTVWVAKVG